MPSFEDLGLREELLRHLEDEDLASPTALQEGVIPALRRGGNLVARASSGSGKTLAYALGVLDRFDPSPEEVEPILRMLVVTPDAGEADRIATAINHLAHAVGLRVAAPAASWGTPVEEAGVLVGPPAEIMNAVRSSAVKLETVEAVVVDGASTIAALGALEQVDALLDLVPRDAQRVLISSALPPAVEDLIDRRVKRALRYPAEPAIAGLEAAEPPQGTIGYVVTAEGSKLSLLAEQLGRKDADAAPPIIFCRNDDRAATLAESLSNRGFVVGQADDVDVDVAIAAGGVTLAELLEELEIDAVGQTISYDVPPDATTLLARHAGDPDAVALLEPRELPHLQEIARQARVEARPTPLPGDVPASGGELEAFRAQIRDAIATEDLAAQFLVLAPLFEEYTAAEIAAAASALLRSRRPLPATGEAKGTAAVPARSRPVERGAPTGPAPVTWARLFVGVGSRDDIKPGDLLGALAGEAGIPGSRIGKIEIRDSFSIVEVQADVADRVIQSVNGTTMKGRSIRVDYDRGGPARRPPGHGAAPRRTTRRPPRE